MKRILVGAIVGAFLMFAWQAISHMFLDYHNAGLKQAPNSEAIMAILSSSITEEGQYFLPDIKPHATPEEQEAMSKQMEGKPWAFITYHKSWEMDMVTPMIRQFAIMLTVLALFILILGRNNGNYASVFGKTLATGFIIFLAAWYPQNIWYDAPWPVLQAELIDLVVGWGLTGLWLGWWLNRKSLR